MYAVTPNARTVGAFFRGEDNSGRMASQWALTASIFISWIFAKSVTNAANLGASYGIVGGLACATYWLSIPLAVLLLVLPKHGVATLLGVGEFKLAAGVDLLLVAGLQILSYPFHDPVLTDRGFITEEKAMLKAFILAGVGGFFAILAFGFVGIDARLDGLAVGGNAPAAVAQALGIGALFVMTVLMIAAAGSTLDSTFASLSKVVAQELPAVAGRQPPASALHYGTVAMIAIAALGNLPMIAGAEILAATTLGGTMVMGLAPVFLLQRWVGYSPWSFHLSFWPGLLLGLLLAIGWIPAAWAIGEGKYALLLGANLYGLPICTAGFLLPEIVRRGRGMAVVQGESA